MKYLSLAFFSLCFLAAAWAQQPDDLRTTLQKPAELAQDEWNNGAQMYFIGRLFLDKDPQAPAAENLLLQTRIGFKILLRGGIEERLKERLAEYADKEINLCIYFFPQRVSLTKFKYEYDAASALKKIVKETLDLDAWAIPLFVFKVYEPLAMDPPAYRSAALTPQDEEFKRMSSQKPLIVVGKINGTVLKTNLKPAIASLTSVEVAAKNPDSGKTENLVFFIDQGTKIIRKTPDNKTVAVAADALKTKNPVEVWYEVSGFKKIALTILINE